MYLRHCTCTSNLQSRDSPRPTDQPSLCCCGQVFRQCSSLVSSRMLVGPQCCRDNQDALGRPRRERILESRKHQPGRRAQRRSELRTNLMEDAQASKIRLDHDHTQSAVSIRENSTTQSSDCSSRHWCANRSPKGSISKHSCSFGGPQERNQLQSCDQLTLRIAVTLAIKSREASAATWPKSAWSLIEACTARLRSGGSSRLSMLLTLVGTSRKMASARQDGVRACRLKSPLVPQLQYLYCIRIYAPAQVQYFLQASVHAPTFFLGRLLPVVHEGGEGRTGYIQHQAKG